MHETSTTNKPAVKQGSLKLLHVGCGSSPRERLPAVFRSGHWHEIRYDIDPAVQPDIVGSISDMTMIATASVDAIWSSHSLEHLHSFDVPSALAEFRRVLRPNGFALISVPDLKAVAMHVVHDQLTDTLYQSASGPITALDVIFGHQRSIEYGNPFMSHRTGFTATSLGRALAAAGFDEVRVHEGSRWDLWAVATMPETSGAVFAALSQVMQ
ncbi:MAG: class I SAM-dependent methyltransferase [Telluria sp.]